MEPNQADDVGAAVRRARAEAGARYDLALEPAQAWCLKGHFGEPDEVVIPGLLLDDLGGCTAIEATLALPAFHQMLAMAGRAELAMLADRASETASRTRPEANVWAVVAERVGRRIAVKALLALDRVVVDGYGARRVDLLRAADLIPNARD
jgi:hypothetical protein